MPIKKVDFTDADAAEDLGFIARFFGLPLVAIAAIVFIVVALAR